MVEKEFGERNFGFDSLRYMTWRRKGLLPRDHRLGTASCRRRWGLSADRCGGGPSAARLRQETTVVNNPFFLHAAVHVFQGVKPKFLSPNFF